MNVTIFELFFTERSIRLLPSVLAIRNKRRRERMVKRYHRHGVREYLAPVRRITVEPPASAEHHHAGKLGEANDKQ